MKKILAAVICITLATASTFAKGHNNADHDSDAQPRVEQQNHRFHDPVVDMGIIKELGLSDKQVKQIEDLQQRKHQEMESKRAQAPRPEENRQEARKHHGEKGPHNGEMKDFRDSYRKELRGIMGDDKYISYMERQNDRMAFNGHHRHQHHRNGDKGHMSHQTERQGA